MRDLASDLAGGHRRPDAHMSRVAGKHLPPGQDHPDTHALRAGGDHLASRDHLLVDIHGHNVAAGNTLPPAKFESTPSATTPGVEDPTAAIHQATPKQCAPRSGPTTLPATTTPPTPTSYASSAPVPTPGHGGTDTQFLGAGGGDQLPDAMLALLASSLDDLEGLRIATTNRLRSLTAISTVPGDTAKGIQGTPDEQRMAKMIEAIADLEKQATRDLERAMRAHPLGAWVKATVGVGEKQGARLLAAIGDPATRPNPAKLWQYAGHGDPARSKLRKGQPVEHNPTAKMRVRLIAESCIKQAHSPYRPVYDRERAKWADRDTTDGHKHSHALRVVGKAMLLDLWRAAQAA